MSDRCSYVQDRLGNEERQLGEYRARDGDFVDVAGGDTGTDVKVYELPDDVQEFHITEIQYFDQSSTAATFELYDAELDSNGAVSSKEQITTTFQVTADDDVLYQDLVIEPVTGGAVVINTDSASEVRVGGHAVGDEQYEPASEVTETP